jgi:hypothetical protein
LGLECRDQSEAYVYEPLAPEPRSLRRVDQGTPTSTSTSAGRVQFEHDDPLRRIPATEYLPVIAGVEVSSNGRCRCPMPDHEDLHPSAKAYGARWHCFACGAGGSIIDLAVAIYGIEPSGPDYWRLRDRILEALVWSPLRHEATP